jgi:thiosulfate/3-mercaptopyruvate sulfurtransferase
MRKFHQIASAAAILGLSLVGHLSLSPLAAEAQTVTSLPAPLVTAQWLHDHLDQVTVVDIRDNMQRLTAEPRFNVDAAGKKTLAETGGHIPGAISVDFTKIRQTRVVNGVNLTAMMPTKEAFQATMDASGLNKQRPIVIVAVGDTVDSMDMATRLFFQLKYFGEDNIAVLNGGTNGWLNAGYQINSDPIKASHGDWVATDERKDILATTEDVKAAIGGHSNQLVDARPTAQFFGITKSPVVTAAGHLEGARSFPTEVMTRPAGGAQEFLSEKQYRTILQQLQIDPDRASISYCNTGHLGSGAWFVMHEIFKNRTAKLYAGSMNEWTHLGNPVIGLQQ